MLILKQNAANTVPTPPSGKGTIFLDDSDTLSVKISDGNVQTFPTVGASNAQVVFMNGTTLSGESEFTYDFNTNVLTVNGNVAAGNVKTDNLLYANGTAWEFGQDPGGSNTQIQFNDDGSFAGSAALTFNKTTNAVSMSGTLDVTGNANVGNLTTTGTVSVGALTATGNALINGNLSVNGNIVYVNVETLDIEDPVIVLGGGPNGAAPTTDDGKDRGTLLQYYSGTAKNAFMGWDASNSEFGMGAVVSMVNDVVTFTNYGNLRVANIIGNGQALTGINGANVTGTVANAAHAGTANTVVDSAQPNITSVGTLSTLAVSSNVTSQQFIANALTGIAPLLVSSTTVVANLNADLLDGYNTAEANTAGTIAVRDGNGNISANYFIGNGALLTGIDATSIQNGNSNVVVTANSNVAVSVAGNANVAIFTGVGANINGTLGVSGNATVGNLETTDLVVNGNMTTGGGSGGNISGADNISANTFTGVLTTAAQPNITSVGTLTGLNVNGNIVAANITANTGVFTGNGSGLSALAGANVTGQVANALVAGTVYTNAQPNITSVGTLSSLAVTGNVTAGNVYSNSGTIGASLLTGTLTTAAQPNVTSVGTLSSLTVTGNVTAGNANLGNLVAANYVSVANDLTVLGSANIGGGSGGNISGVDNITANTFTGTLTTAAQPNITSLGTLTSLSVTGNVSAGNVNGGNLVTANFLAGTLTTASQPNITSVGTLGSLSVTGNISAGNVSATDISGTTLGGTLTTAAQPNVTSLGTLTSLSVTGNANVGNIGATAGVFTGNISALNADLGNLVTANIANLVELNVSGNANIGGGAGGNISGANNITANTFTGTLTTAAQPNITSVGTLTDLTVTGNASAGNLSTGGTLNVTGNANVGNLGTAGLIVATGNITGGNLTTAGALSVTGNANVGNIGATNGIFTTVQGTLSTAAQPNITSVGTLTSLSVTGNVTAGNVSATDVSGTTLGGTLTTAAQPNITSVGTLTSLSVTGNVAAGNLTTTGILSVTGTGTSSIAGNLDMTSNNIVNLASPVNDNDAATKAYVDNLASTGIHYHTPVRVESPVALTATYNNGTAGVGATLTNSGANAALVIDGISLNVADRVLVYQQTDQTTNGVYVVTTVGDGSTAWVLTRASDADTYAPSTSTGLDEGSYFYVQEGNTGAGESYVCNTVGVITFGTTNITFAQFSASQVYQAGTGLTLTNTTFSVNASQSQITSVGTLTGLNVNGNITAANITANTGVFTGNGSGLSAIAGGNVTGQVANALVAGTVYTAAQPNITSVGTLTSLAVTGNASAGNISTGGTLSVTGNANVGNIGATNGVFTNVSGNGAALTALNASNISSGTLAQARLANASLTLGNTTLTLGGTTTTVAGLSSVTSTTFVGALTGAATTAGTVTTAAQPNITSVGTLSSLSVTGNISAGNVSATTFTGALSGAATTAGTVTTAAQPNITSVGTLTSLSVSGALTTTQITTGANTTAGTITGNWTLTTGSRLQATYADLAEKYVADASYEAGTVLVFGGEHEVTMSHEFDSHRVAGVVSTDPAYIMNAGCEGEHVAVLALQGRVPCKVHGPVAKGDLMVAGPNGQAVANNMARAGTIIGKALENFAGGAGIIEVVVGRF